MAFTEGPYVNAAFFCERVLREADGVQSYIRVVDRLTHAASGPEPPEEMEPFEYPIFMVAVLKSGRARGRHALRLALENPSGEIKDLVQQDVMFEGEERGVSIVAQAQIRFSLEGLHWLHVYVDGQDVTRSPLRVIYSRTIQSPPPEAPREPPESSK